MASIRKGILSLLYGIAVDRDLISLDATLAELGVHDPGAPLPEKERSATLQDLLTSRSEIYFSAGAESGWMRENRPSRGSAAPDEEFFHNYCSFNALGVIFEDVTGLEIGEARDLWIAEPIGMEGFSPENVIHRELSDDSAFPTYRIYLSAHDLARLGALVAAHGVWDEHQILPQSWIDRIRTPVSPLSPEEDGSAPDAFSYSWWIEGETQDLYHEGWAGQYLIIDDVNDLVIVTRRDIGHTMLGIGLFFLWGTQGEFHEVRDLREILMRD